MGIISLEQADHLYWLGRYTERVYSTLRLYSKSYDRLIDDASVNYEDFCKSIDIPNVYQDKSDFLRRYPFDADVADSVISNLNRAYDNAIVLRESIGSECLSYIQLAIYDMNRAAVSSAPLVELQKVIDSILAFYGIADDQIDNESVRNIIKAGKRIERIDMYARLGLDKHELYREVCRMIPRVERCGLRYSEEKLQSVRSLVEAENLDYYAIVSEVESIL